MKITLTFFTDIDFYQFQKQNNEILKKIRNCLEEMEKSTEVEKIKHFIRDLETYAITPALKSVK